MHHLQTCCCICSGSQTRCTVFKCTRHKSFSPNTCRTWPSTTTHSNTHRQHNNSQHCQQHHQTTTITFDGNLILLVTRWQNTKVFQVLLPTGPSKHHTADIHQHVRPYYVHMDNSPTLLPQAMKPSTRQGCAEILGDPYFKKSPLPSI